MRPYPTVRPLRRALHYRTRDPAGNPPGAPCGAGVVGRALFSAAADWEWSSLWRGAQPNTATASASGPTLIGIHQTSCNFWPFPAMNCGGSRPQWAPIGDVSQLIELGETGDTSVADRLASLNGAQESAGPVVVIAVLPQPTMPRKCQNMSRQNGPGPSLFFQKYSDGRRIGKQYEHLPISTCGKQQKT